MYQWVMAVFFGLSLTLYANRGYCQQSAGTDADEIQILIDVSGSMKQNDPHNLRVDACKLLMNLLPDGSRASLWLFAEKTSLLTAGDRLDADWKRQAAKFCEKIHARGVYTHIEEAIQNVMQQGFAGNGQKHLILLTDGMVDISQDIMVSADSRERILSEWIPQLQQRQIKVETIALSTQADRELLEKLAVETGGWNETADSAEQLQRVFLKMAQKAAPKETLPLKDNRFSVDAGINEFSLLVFKKPSAQETQLFAPGQHKVGKHDAAAAWIDTAGYDLITVKKPMAGEWAVDAAVDPDNKVMVLTDLKLQLEALPNFIATKQPLTLRAFFTEQGKQVTRADFLNLLALTVTLDHQSPQPMSALTAADAGFWSYTVAEMSSGKHTLTITADGKSFQREITAEIEVLSAPIDVEMSIDHAQRSVSLKLLPDAAVLDLASLAVTAVVRQADKPPETHVIANQNGQWILQLQSLPPGSSMQVSFNVMAKTQDGKALEPTLAPITIDDATFKVDSPLTQELPAVVAEQAPVHEEAATDEKPQAETAWGMVIAIVLGVNLLVLAAGFLIHKAIKKSTAAKQEQLLERLS